jgi:hypothetical protein
VIGETVAQENVYPVSLGCNGKATELVIGETVAHENVYPVLLGCNGKMNDKVTGHTAALETLRSVPIGCSQLFSARSDLVQPSDMEMEILVVDNKSSLLNMAGVYFESEYTALEMSSVASSDTETAFGLVVLGSARKGSAALLVASIQP